MDCKVGRYFNQAPHWFLVLCLHKETKLIQLTKVVLAIALLKGTARQGCEMLTLWQNNAIATQMEKCIS